MKFPLSLLKKFLTTDASLEQISATLTSIGLEVDGIEDKSAALAPFVVAEILHAEKHPQADKLQVCRVKAAQGELQIVCGAPNARAGINVALANIGTVIPTNRMEIKAARVRGVESQGMLCSGEELGISADGTGIIELPASAQIGQSIVDVLGLGDPIIDIAITANRGDCMGVYGVARDLAAAGLGTLNHHAVPKIKADGKCPVAIRIDDREGCPAFLGRVIRGVKNGPSPEWLQRILTAAGMRPISALVDITNYFSLAYGRPLHVYDLAKLHGSITARAARDGETLDALNEKNYRLNTQCCVIADDARVLGIGGVMGGTFSGVTESTTDILLEVALFDPIRIAKTGRALQIDSDARARFERGVDPHFVAVADTLATAMILELCGGTSSDRSLAGDVPERATRVVYDPLAVNAMAGFDIPVGRQIDILKALGFTADGKNMIVPSWRHDVAQPADLAEEIMRIAGYDAIPMQPLPKRAAISKPALDAKQARDALLRRAAARRGLHETYSWGFCSEAQAAIFGGQHESLKLLNPISADLSVMRPRILPHLLDAVRANHDRGMADVALFELGAIFHDTTPEGQRTNLTGVRSGSRTGAHWSHAKQTDVFDVKADLFFLLESAGINTAQLTVLPTKDAKWFHPGRSGVVGLGPKNMLGSFGEIHPSLLKQLGIDAPVYAFSLFISALPAPKAAKRKPLATSDYQATLRDFAFLLDEKTPAADLIAAINKADKELLRNVAIFDVYQGKGIDPGKKSIALTVTLQAVDRTLTDAEIDRTSQAIIASAMKIGAVLRA